jgi:hypothetical protein
MADRLQITRPVIKVENLKRTFVVGDVQVEALRGIAKGRRSIM